MNPTLLFKTFCLVLCISSLGNAQSDTIPNNHQYRSLWIGTEMLRSLFVFNESAGHNTLPNKALELNVAYGLKPHLRAYMHVGYASLQGQYFGDAVLFPYNVWSTGLGIEFPFDVRIPLVPNLELKFDVSLNMTFNPAMKNVKDDDFVRNRYYVPGVSLATISEDFHYGFNLGIGLIYRIDWLRKK